jgi:type VI secretion system protein ImpJ
MFLRPHHLQQYDRYLESREIAYLNAVEHHGWGLIELEIQEESLANFVLAARSLRAVLPDGTLVDVPGNARIPGRTLDKKSFEAGRPVDVTIGVRRLEERRPQTAGNGAAAGQARFLTVSEEVYDLDAGRDPASIEQFEYDLQFFLGEEPTQGYETLPVARLMFTGDPARPIRLAPGFAPPSLVLSASPVLHGLTRGVVERLSTVLRETGDVRGSDKAGELILFQALSGSLPVLKDMVQDGKVHPRRAYLEMARLVGTLYFRDDKARSLDDIPLYDHRDPGPVFEKLRELTYELSTAVIVKRYRKFPMEKAAGDLFRVGLPPDGKVPGVRLFLEVGVVESAPKVKALMVAAKISAPERIPHLKQFALPGIANEALQGPPPELPPGQTGYFFRLKLEEGNEWPTHVIPAGVLATFLLGAPPDLKLTLIVISPGG